MATAAEALAPVPRTLTVLSLATNELELARERRWQTRLALALDEVSVEMRAVPQSDFAELSVGAQQERALALLGSTAVQVVLWIEPPKAAWVRVNLVWLQRGQPHYHRLEAPEVARADADLALAVRELFAQLPWDEVGTPERVPPVRLSGPALQRGAASLAVAGSEPLPFAFSSTAIALVGVAGGHEPWRAGVRLGGLAWVFYPLGVGASITAMTNPESSTYLARYAVTNIALMSEVQAQLAMTATSFLELSLRLGGDYAYQRYRNVGGLPVHSGVSFAGGASVASWLRLGGAWQVGAALELLHRRNVVELRRQSDGERLSAEPHTLMGVSLGLRVLP